MFDTRVGILTDNQIRNNLLKQESRDKRLVMFKNETEWIHPLWKPQAEATVWLANFRAAAAAEAAAKADC